MKLTELPAVGQALAAGIFAGLTTTSEGKHVAVVLLPDKPAKALAWKDAMAWALSIDAQLPSRPIGALLFANCRDAFDDRWHWTADEFSGSVAWFQYFDNGFQDYGDKSYEARAPAVRLIQLTA